MAKFNLDREIAWAVATDAGNRNMRRAGRSVWNREDYEVAARRFVELWPEPRDPEPSP